MVQAVSQQMTLGDFWDWYPDGYGRYELWNGVVIEMQPTGPHEQIGGFLAGQLFLEINRLQLPYLIPRQALVKPLNTDKSGYNPDVIVLDQLALNDEPLWKKHSTITNGESVKVVIEIVSTNWRDDYGHKFIDYEALGISEYWIVDYLGLAGKRYIGSFKQPTFSVYYLNDGEYQMQQTEQELEFEKFLSWLRNRYNINTTQSWASLVLFHSVDERDALDRFFKLWEQFKTEQK